MIYVRFTSETETRALVDFIHRMPFDEVYGMGKTEEQLEQTGALLDEPPKPQVQEGKNAVLYINPQTRETWYEYVDIPLPEEVRLAAVEIATEENKKANLDTQEAVLQLYEMVTGPQT